MATPFLIAHTGNSSIERALSIQSLQKAQRALIMSTANGGDDELRPKGQQSPLVSQREISNNAPTEANRKGKMSTYFPLGYKEGFSQWVCAVTKKEEKKHSFDIL